MNKVLALAILATLSMSVTAEEISNKQYGEKWPFSVAKGELACYGNAVTFTSNGTVYAINGTASSLGYADITPIWKEEPEMLAYQNKIAKEEGKTLAEIQKLMGVLRISISPIIEAGLALCK